MGKIKVLQIFEDLEIGGLERIIVTLVEELDQERYDPEVWCIAKGGDIAEELIRKGKVVRILGIKSYYNPINILRFAYELKKASPRIIHSHGYFSNTISRIAAILAGVPIKFVHLHNVYSSAYSRRNLAIERFLSLFTDKIICCSDAVRRFAIDYEKINPHKLLTIYNAINLERFTYPANFQEMRERLGLLAGEKLIGTIGSLRAVKGHRYFLEAARLLTGKFPHLKFAIVGGGSLETELKMLARNLGLEEKVIFTGSQRDVSGLLKAMDIFVLASLREGMPLSVIEAQACGLPIVATKIGGVPEVVKDGVSGILVAPKSPEAISKAVISLLKDSQKAKEMGRAGQRICRERFSSKIMIAKIERLYNDFI